MLAPYVSSSEFTLRIRDGLRARREQADRHRDREGRTPTGKGGQRAGTRADSRRTATAEALALLVVGETQIRPPPPPRRIKRLEALEQRGRGAAATPP